MSVASLVTLHVNAALVADLAGVAVLLLVVAVLLDTGRALPMEKGAGAIALARDLLLLRGVAVLLLVDATTVGHLHLTEDVRRCHILMGKLPWAQEIASYGY
ncbi:Uncharacterized protein Rs2_16884 [Raphanus sativus]|nr:Uncharacterized protein Rs2_16884 [Raphanus sativus]